ncbi:TetR/AcrR family transcriptional regulator [uncultured Enterococcus sp.]|uniref:TetR/AcrR family transcriptional regulator n=1 Tax=uncultured Enterococcus sp. TaxID=167972 RepID=UPI0025889304|nr:TetR/AcrR family transcriptional regulator [uncultured Enterococcus sp.]
MKKGTTKERIVEEASRLFAKKGYEAVNVEVIAQAVGIKAPSLYKHYRNKQELFDAVVVEMNSHYEATMSAFQMDGYEGEADAPLFAEKTEEQLVVIGIQFFMFFLHDDYVSNFRKLLTIEQFQNPRLAALFTQQYTDKPLAYQEKLFTLLIEADVLRKYDPKIMALHFYAPIQLLLTLCDRQPEREPEALRTVEQHIRQFYTLYQKGTNAHE